MTRRVAANSSCESMENWTTRLLIKVVPASSRDCIAGWLGETLKVRVRAPAECGKANAEEARIRGVASLPFDRFAFIAIKNTPNFVACLTRIVDRSGQTE